MAGLDVINIPGGLQYDINDYGHYPLWSTHAGIWSAKSQESKAFTYVSGENIPGTTGRMATELDTNLKSTVGGLGYQEEMLVFSIMVEFPQHPLEQNSAGDAGLDPDKLLLYDMQTVTENTLFQFVVTEKTYNEGPLTRYPFGGGIWAVSAVNNHEAVNNGSPEHRAQKPLALPIHLQSLESFRSIFKFPYGSVGTLYNVWETIEETKTKIGYDFRVWLDGIRRRIVA